MKRKSLTIGLAGLAGLAACGALLTGNGRQNAARADATNYGNQKRAIRACVLVTEATQDKDVGGTVYPSNVVPHVFYALDSRTDLKPVGFDFINPLAPENITQDVYNRWRNRSTANNGTDRAFTAGTPEANLFRVGAPCTKNIGAYWEVNLSKVTATDLQQFDVVLIALHGNRPNLGVQFTPDERERLRHYVDQGGTIWLENEGEGSGAWGQGNFFELLDMGAQPGANNPVTIQAPLHPLVSYPYYISPQNANELSIENNMNSNVFVDANPTKIAYGGSLLPLSQATQRILTKGGLTTVYAGDYGAGHLLVTSANIAGDINNYLLNGNKNTASAGSQKVIDGGTFNDGVVSGDNLQAIPPTDLKFAYNLCSWISSVPAPGSNQRRTGSTQENIGSSLATKWASLPITTPLNVGSGASIYKGRTFWVDGNNYMHCFDTNPLQKLSNLPYPDDGIIDFNYGFPYDEVWNDTKQRTMPDPASVRASTPTANSVTDPGSGALFEKIYVQTSDGSLFIYNMVFGSNNAPALKVQRTAGNMLPSLSTTTPAAGAMPGASAGAPFGNPFPKPVPAPACSDGIVFWLNFNNPKGMGELGWRIEAMDVAATFNSGNGTYKSVFGNNDGSDAAPSPSVNGTGLPGFFNPQGSLTVGEVRDPVSDAVDKIIYVPCGANDIAKTTGVVHGVWFSTRREQLRSIMNNSLPAEFPAGQTFLPDGNRGRIPWYASTANPAPASINLNPVVHIVTENGNGAVTNIQTLRYPADFTVSYKPDNEYMLADPADPASTRVPIDPPGNRMHVVLRNITPGPNDKVYADYTVDWPGIAVGSTNTPSPIDMALIADARRYQMFPQSYNTMAPEFSGGAALSGDDNLLFAETNLRLSNNSDVPLPDRLMSVRDQYIGSKATNGSTGTGPGVRPNVGQARQAGPYVNWMFSPMENVTLDNTYANGMFNGYQVQARLIDPLGNKQPIYDFKAIGSPVTSNGTVYVLGAGYRAPQSANGGGTPAAPDYTVLLALRENVDATVDVGPIAENGSVNLLQPSLIAPQNPIRLRPGVNFNLERVQDPVNGGYKGIAHIFRFQAGAGSGEDIFNLAMPIWVEAAGNGGAGQNGQAVASAPPKVNPLTGYGILDNLQYYVVIPRSGVSASGVPGVIATSGPSISGNTLYFAADRGQDNRLAGGGTAQSLIVTVDLQRAVTATGGNADVQGVTFVSSTPALTDLTTGGPLATTFPSIHPPLGTTNVMIATNAQSLAGLDNGLVLIADSHRLVEVDAGGNAFWTMEATRSQTQVGGANLDNGGLATTPVALSRPSSATRFQQNDFLIVDTGNNRIVGADRGSTARFEIHQFQDGAKLLRPGDPLTFNQPTDVQVFSENWSQFQIQNRDTNVTYKSVGPCTVYHYLVADSGNYRIAEIVDVYDTNGQLMQFTASDGSANILGEKLLAFVTRSLGEQNQQYRYRTVQDFQLNGIDYIIASISNQRQGNTGGAGVIGNDNTNFDGPGGSLIVILRSDTGPNPNGGAPLKSGDVYNTINSFVVVDSTGKAVRRQKISNPTWFKEFSVADISQGFPANPAQTPRFMLADTNGCYILRYDNTLKEYVTDWMLTAQDYYFITGRKLQATSIYRETLADLTTANRYPNVNRSFEARLLITNSYSGADNLAAIFGNVWAPSAVQGEVFEVRTKDYFDHVNGTNNMYDGYTYSGGGYNRQRYTAGGGFNPLGSITRMIPNETIVNNAGVRSIKRRIGSLDNGLSTFILEQPQYAEKPF